tara:strand:- start:555 stop:857 length:303 start_codon:yes stop_codon:yes gene_type:complete
MAYGLKIWTASGYVAFDSEDMNSYVKVISSGSVTLGANQSETIAVPGGFYYYYVTGPTVDWNRSFNASKNTSSEWSEATSLTIQNLTNETTTFGYIVITL